VAVTSVSNRAGAIRVRSATTTVLNGVYSAAAGTITGPGATVPLPAVDGVNLVPGDLVLVRLGTSTGGAAANGVYAVTDIGIGGAPWVLTRAADTGLVVTTEGNLRAATTGQAFLVAYDSLGNDPLEVSPVDDGGTGTGRPRTSIGSDNISSTTNFVVSSTAGTNDAAGSLGKMISLLQGNDSAADVENGGKLPEFRFATVLPGLNGGPDGAIRLTQELPVITRPLFIDGNARSAITATTPATGRIVVDGSRITTTRLGSPASLPGVEVNGFAFGPSSGMSGSTPGASVANLTVGGFARGAAVKVDGAAGILVRSMTLGRNEAGSRLANRFGVQITGGAAGTTVLGSTIVGSSAAGVKVDTGAVAYTVVGSTIGAANQNNGVGIDSAGTGRIGVNPLQGVVINASTTFNSKTISLPANVPLASIYLGQTVGGVGIPANTTIAAISPDGAGGYTLTLSAAMTRSGPTKLLLGRPLRTVVEQNLTGVNLAGGTTIVTNSDIRANTNNGIQISAGTHAVGTSKTLGGSSNEITSNGRYGVFIPNQSLATRQQVWGNYFGRLAPNKLGNVGVNNQDATKAKLGLGYELRPRSTIDTLGNSHLVAAAATAVGGGTNAHKPKQA
jgi:hypothetical protein